MVNRDSPARRKGLIFVGRRKGDLPVMVYASKASLPNLAGRHLMPCRSDTGGLGSSDAGARDGS